MSDPTQRTDDNCIRAFQALASSISDFCCYAGFEDNRKLLETIQEPMDAFQWLTKERTLNQQSGSDNLRLLSPIFSTISLEGAQSTASQKPDRYYPLQQLRPSSLFPKEGMPNGSKIKEQYRNLWRSFQNDVKKIPAFALESWPLWLDHLQSAWASVAWCIPSGSSNEEKYLPLYEKSRIDAAFANAQSDKVLLIQGDFQGIQNFIFTRGSSTNRHSAKLLRGRSFYVSLITQLTALKILEELDLSCLSVLNEAAGKFLILAADSEENKERINKLRELFSQWFVENTLGTSRFTIGCLEIERESLLANGSAFSDTMNAMFKSTEQAKLTAPGVLDRTNPVLEVDYSNGVSPYDERMPASSALCEDQIKVGTMLVRSRFLLITQSKPTGHTLYTCKLPVFGFFISFLDAKQPPHAVPADTAALWDFSIPKNSNEPIFRGVARREFNAYVARFDGNYLNPAQYKTPDSDEVAIEEVKGNIKTFSHLADEDRHQENDEWLGISALGALKGDVDNLGKIFRVGLGNQTLGLQASLGRMMTVSRTLQSFFTVFVPSLCAERHPSVYTVFAGGDDFFFIGPWHQIQYLARDLHDKFTEFVCNDELHFSAGIASVKPDCPPRNMALMTEFALEQSKGKPGKNSYTVFGTTVPWTAVPELQKIEENLVTQQKHYDLSTGYLYKLFGIIEMADQKNNPAASIWRARLSYNTARMIKDKKSFGGDAQDFLSFIVPLVENHGKTLRIPLTNIFYNIRKA